MDYTENFSNVYFPQIYIASMVISKRLGCDQFLQIVGDLKKVNLYLKNQKYKKAIMMIDRNIALLGDHYLSSKSMICDDTGTKLMLGNIEQEKGLWKRAAYLKRNVLESRVSVFQQTHQCPAIK